MSPTRKKIADALASDELAWTLFSAVLMIRGHAPDRWMVKYIEELVARLSEITGVEFAEHT